MQTGDRVRFRHRQIEGTVAYVRDDGGVVVHWDDDPEVGYVIDARSLILIG